MADNIACLRGWHPALAKAELSALFPNNEIICSNSQRLVSISGEIDIEKAARIIQYSSGTQAILHDCVIMNWGNESSIDDFISQISTKIETSGRSGSFGVTHWRQEGKIEALSGSKIAGIIGGIAGRNGFTIDLDKPDNNLGLVLDGSSSQLVCGWLYEYVSKEGNSNTRRATERPFFKPISLDPKLARLAVNLASGPLNENAVLDPMTGTGGFVIEAALMGRNAVAIDLEQEMVDGARKNVLWALECEGITSTKQFEIIEGDATDLINSVPKRWHKKISGMVLDPPYGRNSHGSITHFDLIRNTLNSFRDIASNDATIVLILPIHPLKESKLKVKQDSDEIILLHGEWRDFQKLLVECNWKVEGLWIEHVHSSLGRLILHASNALQG